MMWDWTVTLEDDVPYLNRVEMDAPGARVFDFPVDKVRIAVNQSTVSKGRVEVSEKLVGYGALTIVNKTGKVWPEGTLLRAYVP